MVGVGAKNSENDWSFSEPFLSTGHFQIFSFKISR